MTDPRMLEEKVALITGAASGIGRATSLLFAEQGAKLVLADVDETGNRETARLVAERGGEALCVGCDVTDSAQVQELVDAAVQNHGRLDCAFNNAGVGGQSAPLAEYDEADFNRVIAVNLTSVFLCMRSELRQMLAQGAGAIVNTASVVGVIGYPAPGGLQRRQARGASASPARRRLSTRPAESGSTPSAPAGPRPRW